MSDADEARGLRRLVWLLLKQAGGTVTVSREVMRDFDPVRAVIGCVDRPDGDGVTYTADAEVVTVGDGKFDARI